MKKLIAIAIVAVMALALCTGVFAAGPVKEIKGQDLLDLLDGSSTKNTVTAELKEEGGQKFVTCTASGNDPYFIFSTPINEGVDNPYVVVKYRTSGTVSSFDIYTEIAEPHAKSADLVTDGQWHYTVLDLTFAENNWKGAIKRFDVMNGEVNGCSMDIAAVAIFATKEDAKAYGGNDLVFPKNPDDVEQPADDKDEYLYKYGAGANPTVWVRGQGDKSEKVCDISFTASIKFNGFVATYYAIGGQDTVVKLQLLDKDGNELESTDLTMNGDTPVGKTEFKKTYEPGDYTLRYTTGETGDYFVIGTAKRGDSTAKIVNNGNEVADVAPYIKLINAEAGNPGTADAAVIAIAAVACIALAGVVVAKKVR